MILQCAFPSAQSAAAAVHRYHKDVAASPSLTARPHNRFEPVHTTWWLVPGTEWPAYGRGKLIFHYLSSEGRNLLNVGLHVEKGFGRVVAKVDSRARNGVMKDGWLWPQLLRDLAAGAVDAAARQVAEQTGVPVRVGVSASYYQDMDPTDPYHEGAGGDDLVFDAHGPRLGLVEQKLNVDLLRGLAKSRSLAELGRGLVAIPKQEWAWFSLILGIPFKMAPLVSGAGLPDGAWDGWQLWDRVLAPWLPWAR